MPTFTVILSVIALVILLGLAGLKILGIWSKNNPPEETGFDFLSHDPGKPNFVSSKATRPERRVDPLTFKGDIEEAFSALETIVSSYPRTKIIRSTPEGLHAEVTSPFFGFVDDLVFIIQREDSQIHIRSSSRVGYSDMGANAERVRNIRSEWEKRDYE